MTDDKARSAGIRQPERLAQGLDAAGIVKAVKSNETRSTLRVYRKEWMHQGFYDSLQDAENAMEKFIGRVLPEEISVVQPDEFSKRIALEVKLWNVVQETRDEDLAHAFATSLQEDGEEIEVVVRNSRSEHALISYGVLKL